MASALRVWCASVAAPKGMKMAARPAAATSAVVIAPERQRIKSAWAKRSAIFSMKGTTSARNSRRACVQRINYGAVDGQSASAAAGNKDIEWFAMLFARDREEFVAHGYAGGDGSIAKALGCFRETAGHAICEAREDAVGEARFDIRLENHSGDAVQARRENHWAGSIAADAERDVEMMMLHDFLRVPYARGKHGQIARELSAAHAFQACYANGFERQPGLRHEARF